MSEEGINSPKMANYIKTIPVHRYDLYGLAKDVNDVNKKQQHPLVAASLTTT